MKLVRKLTKRELYIVGIFILLLCAVIYVVTNPLFFVQETEMSFTGSDSSALEKHVTFLTNLEPTRNYKNVDSLNAAAEYITNVFTEYCDTVTEQAFTIEKTEYKNVICSFNTSGTESIIVGAHYDSYSQTPGADDNASGVAGLLEMSRLLQLNQSPLTHRIDLVAYTLEEPPFFRSEDMGSFRHAQMLQDSNTSVALVLILEMIGFYSNDTKSQALPISLLKPFYPSKGNFIAVISKLGQGNSVRHVKRKMQEVMDMETYSLSGPSSIPGIDFSDHLSYWKHNFPAIMITDTSFYRNQNYHTKTDTAGTLNYSKMADVVNGVYWSIIQKKK